MATTKSLTNNLYPPILPTYQSASLTTVNYKIYFSLSSYNSYDEINNLVQVTVRNQKTNKTALSRTLYPSEIKLCTAKIDSNRTSDDKYYIEIAPSDMQNGFEINQFYKVQIRFTAAEVTTPVTNALDKWLIENEDNFSEWSTVCLIRAISAPTITIRGLEEGTSSIWYKSAVDLIGAITFADETEQDSLNSYTVTVVDENNNIVYTATEYTSDNEIPNEINHQIKYNFATGNTYTITVAIETANDYTSSVSYEILIISSSALSALPGTFTATPDTEMGCIQLDLNLTDSISNQIVIRRASSRDNYSLWEDIHFEKITKSADMTYTWKDYTVECGIYYKYGIQRYNTDSIRGTLTQIELPVMVFFPDFFLGAGNSEIRIKYNPKISSYSHVLSETKVDTLGSQYPFIRRNGAVNYRQFSISGLITLFNDEDEVFITQEDLFQEALSDYEAFRDENYITLYNDDIYEREFRDRIVEFLYDDSVKLFRTMSNGNVLVKLMDISLQPLAEAIRSYVYSFSASAYEVDDCSIDNYEKYGIFNLGTVEETDEVNQTHFGQYYGEAPSGNLLTALDEKYLSLKSGYETTVKYLTDIRIKFEDDSYPVKRNGSSLEKSTDSETTDIIGLGHIVQIDGVDIFVPSTTNRYELVGEDIQINSIIFKATENIQVDYIAVLVENLTTDETNVSSYQYTTRIGQLFDTFDYNESAYSMLTNKYYEKPANNTYYQQLVSLNMVRIEANEGTVFEIKTTNDTEATTVIINSTNVYTLKEQDNSIEELTFKGVYLIERTSSEDLSYLVENQQYYNMGKEYATITEEALTEIKSQGYNRVYSVPTSSTGYIIYWAPTESLEEFDIDTGIVHCSVTAMVDYECETVKGVYQT